VAGLFRSRAALQTEILCGCKTWRRLKGENQSRKVVQSVKFQNGIEVIETPAHHAA